jgi:uncharacterized protein YbjT (DUF2867 family)
MTILVLGGTGKSGRRIAARLHQHDIRVASRRGEYRFDWDDESTWARAAAGADAVYISYYPDVSFPGAADRVGGFARTAVANGVRRLVLLSGRGEPDAEPAEDAVRESGAESTILRCGWFMQNFSEHFLLEPVLDGVIALPAGEVAEPFLDVDDLADVAVAALTRSEHVGAVYELTGPRLLTFADVASELSRATGRDIEYLPVPIDQYPAAAVEAGVPAEEIGPLTELFARVLDGHNAYLTSDVESVLGRPARDFAEYAAQAAATGVWDLGIGSRTADPAATDGAAR